MGDIAKGIGSVFGGLMGGLGEGAPQISGNIDPTIPNVEKRNKQIDDLMLQLENAKKLAPQDQAKVQDLINKIGTGPSVVDAATKQAQNQNMAQAASMAASYQGGINPALAMRQVQDQQALGNQQILAQSIPQALQEQQVQQQAQLQGQLALNEQKQKDEQLFNQLMSQYLNLGFGIDQAQTMANMDAARFRSGIDQANQQSRQQQAGGIMNMLGTVGGAFIGKGK